MLTAVLACNLIDSRLKAATVFVHKQFNAQFLV